MLRLRALPPRRWVLLAAALLLGIPSAAAAQGPNPVDSVKVSLWPEYDRPDVLVIYRVEIPPTPELPTSVRLLIPADAPELTAAAYADASGNLLNVPPEGITRTEGDSADVIELTAPGTGFQIEFYMPLAVTGDQRQFSFIWPGGLTTPAFTYEVQQPVGAQDVNIEPAPTGLTSDSRGLTYHLVDLGAQTAQDAPQVSFSYTKDTSDLSASAAPAGGLAQPEPAEGLRLDLTDVLPWLLLVGGVALVGAGLIYFLRNRAEEARARPRHRASRARAEEDVRVDASPVFCHNCGTQASASDRFCRQCGTALRT
jgi:hypothetical protein